MSQYPLDARGRPIGIGSFVCYTTNSRGSGLQFGEVTKITEKQANKTYWNRNTLTWDTKPGVDFKITVLHTDAFGQPKFEEIWDNASSKRITTDKRSRSGPVEHSEYKFLIL